MRFKSPKTDGYQVFAVTGTNTVSFGIAFDDATRGDYWGSPSSARIPWSTRSTTRSGSRYFHP